MQPPEVEIVRQFVKDIQLHAVSATDDAPLQDLVDAFASSPAIARRDMRRIMERDPAQFFRSACRILKASSEGAGRLCLIELLWRNSLLMISLADPALFTLPAAVALAKRWAQLDPMLDVKLLHLGFPPDSQTASGTIAAGQKRVLAIIHELPVVRHILLPISRLLRRRSAGALQGCRTLLPGQRQCGPGPEDVI